MIDFHLMLVCPETLRAGHVLPKIPWQILIICRHKPKTKGEVGEMGEKGAKEKKRNPENKSPIFFFYFYYFFLLYFVLYLFFSYYFLLAYIIYLLLSIFNNILINKIRLNENKFDYIAAL